MKKLITFASLAAVLLIVVFTLHRVYRSFDAGPPKPNVLLITVDALRADHMGCYGYRLDTTPNIDGIAARGLRFADCTVQWPKTWPSMASLMTGAYPKTTGMRMKQRKLHESLNVMAEVFKDNGYHTGAVVANFNLGKTFNFNQGFDFFIESWEEKWREEKRYKKFRNRPGLVKSFTDATRVTDQAVEWLRSISPRTSFFLWLHYMEPHGPYVPPAEYRAYFEGEYPSEPVELSKIPAYQRQLSKPGNEPIADLGFYKAQYDREIRYLDDEIKRLMERLASFAFEGETLTVITADHGESLSDHNYFLEHGKYSYQACAHVPVIMVMEGTISSNRTISHPVGLIDVARTIFELVDIEPPGSFEGHSLLDMVLNTPSRSRDPRYVFMESGYGPDFLQRTVRCGQWKLIRMMGTESASSEAGDTFQLYDLNEDPAELNNLASKFPRIVEGLSMVLENWYSGGNRVKEMGSEIDLDSLDERSRELLKALGYIK